MNLKEFGGEILLEEGNDKEGAWAWANKLIWLAVGIVYILDIGYQHPLATHWLLGEIETRICENRLPSETSPGKAEDKHRCTM